MKALLSEQNKKLAVAVFGTLIFAAGVNLFITPLNLYSGGFLGIGQIVRTLLVDYAHLPIPSNIDIAGILLYIINVPLLVLAYRSLGRRFFVSTIVCVTFQTVFLTFIPVPTANPILTDRLAGAIVGGAVAGFGSGMTLRNGGSGGGQDILGLYFMKKDRNFSVGKLSMMVNVAVYVACMLMFDLTTVVYSLIYVAVMNFTTDRFHSQNQNMAAIIVTTNDEVLPTVKQITDRSATYWDGIRYFTKSDCRMIFIALSQYEAIKIGKAVKELDDHAFITFFHIDTIVGNYSKHL